MHVVYHNRRSKEGEKEKRDGAEYVSFDRPISVSDFISIHAPLTGDKTPDGEGEFKRMKKAAS